MLSRDLVGLARKLRTTRTGHFAPSATGVLTEPRSMPAAVRWAARETRARSRPGGRHITCPPAELRRAAGEERSSPHTMLCRAGPL
jgi:hypothetical protein